MEAQTVTAASSVVQELRRRILSGTLPPGAALPPERVLAGELAVSRATLREGLSMLSQMGLVAVQRGRGGGAVVTAPAPTTVTSSIALLFQTRSITAGQLCEFRRAIEVEAAQLAATRRTPDELTEIVAALERYVQSGDDAAAQSRHGRAFHFTVAKASGNPLLAETLVSLNDAFAVCFDLQHPGPDSARLIASVHRPIVDAIHDQDPAAARAAMLAHFTQLAQALDELGIDALPVGEQAIDRVGTVDRGRG